MRVSQLWTTIRDLILASMMIGACLAAFRWHLCAGIVAVDSVCVVVLTALVCEFLSPSRRLLLAGGLFVLGVTASIIGPAVTAKINPGGPFISVVGDLLPLSLNLASICAGLGAFPSARGDVKAILLLMFGWATVMIGVTLSGLITWWAWPSLRGDILGW